MRHNRQLLIATLQQTLLRREQLPDAAHTPYFLYIDEFSTFTTTEQSFIDLFERARKYRMGVTLAHQVTADLPSKLLDVIVGNVATMLVLQLGAGDAPYFAKELQLVALDELKQRKLTDQKVAKLEGEAARIFHETGEEVDLLADPNDALRIRRKIRDYSRGGFAASILQNLATGHAVAKVPSCNYGTPIGIPYVRDPDHAPDGDPRPALIARSKQNFGTVRVPEAAAACSESAPAAGAHTRTPPPAPQQRQPPEKDEAEVFKIKFE